MRKADVIVLGAGIAGVCAALHLQMRGRSVFLVDRNQPGDEASRSNAGVIMRDGVTPFAFPDAPLAMLRLVFNLEPSIRYRLGSLLQMVSWGRRAQEATAGRAMSRYAHALAPLQMLAAAEHRIIARQANAERFFRKTGWLKLYQTAEGFRRAEMEMHHARIFGVGYEVLNAQAAADLEPHLGERFYKAVYWLEAESVTSPGGVCKAYGRLFRERGGAVYHGDARTICEMAGGWSVKTAHGPVWAPEVVVALGAWSTDVLEPLGYAFPFIAQRGYLSHFQAHSGASLSRPLTDVENGYSLSPMERGIRLSTGVEFAHQEALPNPVQIEQCRRIAAGIFPLGSAIDTVPAMASRLCLPDSLPILGASPRHRGLWFTVGHGDMGFTLGPLLGRLLAERMTGNTPLEDLTPLSPMRFLS